MESLLTRLASKKLSTYAAITLIFTYTFLLNRDFACSCEPQPSQCAAYMFLPFFIILLIILWTDRSFQRVCRYLCYYSAGCSSETTRNFKCSFVRHILKAALVSLLWIAFVLLDGDWYVCCKNDHSEQQAPLACKAVGNITEKERVIITDLKNESGVIGGLILGGIVLLASLIPHWRKGCKKCYEGKLSCCNTRFLYDKLILEEEDNVLKEFLRKLAKDQLNEEVKKIIKKGWEDCSNIAVNVLKPPPVPEGEGAGEKKEQPGTGNEQENPSPRHSPSLEMETLVPEQPSRSKSSSIV